MDRLTAAARVARRVRAVGLQLSDRLRLHRRWQVDPAPVESVLNIPEHLSPRTAVVVTKAGKDQWLVFDCPCLTGHRVMLNLDRTTRPVWTMTQHDKLTLNPSVDQRTDRRRCHYILKKGRVTWV